MENNYNLLVYYKLTSKLNVNCYFISRNLSTLNIEIFITSVVNIKKPWLNIFSHEKNKFINV